jgi:hypothetical protein
MHPKQAIFKKEEHTMRTPILIGLGALMLISGGTAVFAGEKLVINGKVASNDVRMINGNAYVKLADVAKALGMEVVKRNGEYEIKKAGGANPIQGVTQGKMGDVLFDGKWRFQALRMETPGSYTMKTLSAPDYAAYNAVADWDPTAHVFKAKAGYKLIAIPCRVTNGRNEKVGLWIGTQHHNALADTEGSSHTAIAYDFDGAPIVSKELVPGAKLDFVTLFSVPEKVQVKDLIFTLQTVNEKKGNDVRVSLTP